MYLNNNKPNEYKHIYNLIKQINIIYLYGYTLL